MGKSQKSEGGGMKYLAILLLNLAILLLTGCSYTGHNDPSLQFHWQPHKELIETPRQIYFDNNRKVIDSIVGGACYA